MRCTRPRGSPTSASTPAPASGTASSATTTPTCRTGWPTTSLAQRAGQLRRHQTRWQSMGAQLPTRTARDRPVQQHAVRRRLRLLSCRRALRRAPSRTPPRCPPRRGFEHPARPSMASRMGRAGQSGWRLAPFADTLDERVSTWRSRTAAARPSWSTPCSRAAMRSAHSADGHHSAIASRRVTAAPAAAVASRSMSEVCENSTSAPAAPRHAAGLDRTSHRRLDCAMVLDRKVRSARAEQRAQRVGVRPGRIAGLRTRSRSRGGTHADRACATWSSPARTSPGSPSAALDPERCSWRRHTTS